MQEVVISNLPPVWIQWLGNIGLFLLGAGVMFIAVILFKLRSVLSHIDEMTASAQQMIQDDVQRDMMPDVKAITKNVKQISDDAASTAHNVTGTVNRVSNVVGSVAGKLESPAIRAVGTITGIMAGMRAFSGSNNKQDIVIESKKRGGILGVIKRK